MAREKERERERATSIYRSSTTGWDNCVGGEVAIAHATGGEGSPPPLSAANRGLGGRNGRVHTRVRCIYVIVEENHGTMSTTQRSPTIFIVFNLDASRRPSSSSPRGDTQAATPRYFAFTPTDKSRPPQGI